MAYISIRDLNKGCKMTLWSDEHNFYPEKKWYDYFWIIPMYIFYGILYILFWLIVCGILMLFHPITIAFIFGLLNGAIVIK